MAIFTFANLTSPQQLSDFDVALAQVAALGAIPCTAAGTNTIVLTPFANTPTIASYPDLQPSFVFVAQATSTSAVTINVGSVGARNAYKWNGLTAIGAGDIVVNGIYRATPLLALNGGAGGFVVDTIGVGNNLSVIPFIIDGGGNPITTGNKGSVGPIPWAATIASWSIEADQSGSIALDILRANNAVPAASIVGGGTKPNLTAAQFNGLVAPAGWTSTLLAPNDWLSFSVFSVATVTRVTGSLSLAKL